MIMLLVSTLSCFTAKKVWIKQSTFTTDKVHLYLIISKTFTSKIKTTGVLKLLDTVTAFSSWVFWQTVNKDS